MDRDGSPAKAGTSAEQLVDCRGLARQWPQYAAALAANIGAFALGTVFAWTSPASGPLLDGSYTGEALSAQEESWVGAAMPLGAAAACLPAGYLLDTVGRKGTMLLLIPPFVLGWGMVCWPDGVWMLYAGRFLQGAAGGAFEVAVPVYTAEVSQAAVRGALGSFFELLVVAGVLFVYILGAVVSVFHLSLVCAAVPLLFGAVFVAMPESPLYYVYKGQEEKARSSLRYLRGETFDIEPELAAMRGVVEQSAAAGASLLGRLAERGARRGLGIALGLMAVQQLCGVTAVTFYVAPIFKEANSSLDPGLASIIVGAVEVLGGVASTLLVDRWGRRALLLLSAAVMLLCTTLLGVYLQLQDMGEDVSAVSLLPLLSLSLYIFFFEIGLGPVAFVMVGELFLPHVQAAASGVAVLTNWLSAFLVTKYYTDLVLSVGAGATFLVFSAFTALGIAFIYWGVIETKGRSVEEIHAQLAGDKNTSH